MSWWADGCKSDDPPPRKEDGKPVDCTTNQCPQQRNFLILYGDPGLSSGAHNHYSGRNFKISAETHETEVKKGLFPGAPPFMQDDRMNVAHVGHVSELIAWVAVANVVYLAIFTHAGNPSEVEGGLWLGEGADADTNLCNIPNVAGRTATNTPVSKIPPGLFRSDAQIRLFACKSGYGSGSIAQRMKEHIKVPVYAYTNKGGAIFTGDQKLGHGGREPTQAEKHKDAKSPAHPKKLWLVPVDKPHKFQLF